MKSLISTLLLTFICFFLGCSENIMEPQEIMDIDGPEINARWIRPHTLLKNDPVEYISDGSNFSLSIKDHYQLTMDLKDISNIESGVFYILVNDDPEIRKEVVYEGTVFNYKEGSITHSNSSNSISLGGGKFYDVKPNDRYHFYANFSDEHGNKSTISWTVDLVE